MPEISYGKIVIEALKKDAFSRRSLPMIGTIILAAMCIFKLVLDFIFDLPAIPGVSFDIFGFLFLFIKIFLVLVLFWIFTLFFWGIIIKQAAEEAKGVHISLNECFWQAVRQLKKVRERKKDVRITEKTSKTISAKSNYKTVSWFVKNKMLSLVCASILIAVIPSIIGAGLSIVPYVGGLLNLIVSILIALSVFVTYPYIILGERGSINAITASFHHFSENKIQIIIIWLLRTVIGLTITFIFAIPFIILISILFISSRLPLQRFPPPYFPSMTSVIVISAITIAILAIGLSIATAFSYGVSARYFNAAIERKSL